jgi:hypothetical protein
MSINRDCTRAGSTKAVQQVLENGLDETGRPDKGDDFAWLGLKREVGQQGLSRIVRKRDVRHGDMCPIMGGITLAPARISRIGFDREYQRRGAWGSLSSLI